jgi:hypothetical protein
MGKTGKENKVGLMTSCEKKLDLKSILSYTLTYFSNKKVSGYEIYPFFFFFFFFSFLVTLGNCLYIESIL